MKRKFTFCFILVSVFVCFISTLVFAVELELIHVFHSEEIQYPQNITLTSSDLLLVVDKQPIIHQFDGVGNYLGHWSGSVPENIDSRDFITIHSTDSRNIYLTSEDERTIFKYSEQGELLTIWQDPSFTWLESIYVTDQEIILLDNQRLHILNIEGEILNTYDGLNLWQPLGITSGSDGLLYIADSNNSKVKVVNTQGEIVREWGNEGTEDGQFLRPVALTFDQQDRLFVLDSFVDDKDITYAKVALYTKEGTLLQTIPLNKERIESDFFYPVDLIIKDDHLYICDFLEQCVKVYKIIDNPEE